MEKAAQNKLLGAFLLFGWQLLCATPVLGFEQSSYSLFQIVNQETEAYADGRLQIDASIFDAGERSPDKELETVMATPDVKLDFTGSAAQTGPSSFEDFDVLGSESPKAEGLESFGLGLSEDNL